MKPSSYATKGMHDLALDPEFTDPSGGNFLVGTNMKAMAFLGTLPGASPTGYLDIGAVQRQESAASTEERMAILRRIGFLSILFFITVLISVPSTSFAQLPSSYDWRNVGGVNYVTAIKNQGGCRTCWAMAATAALETQVMKTYGTLLDLSEQVLVSCGGIAACDTAGSEGMAGSYLKNSYGIPVEGYFPYDGSYHNVHSCNEASPADWRLHAFKVTNYRVHLWTDVATIKSDIYNYGPVMAELKEYADFRNYTGGIYSYNGSATLIGGHVVLLIGYNDDGQYFIGKNSLGTSWGESGFFRIAYGEVGGASELGHQITAFEGAVAVSEEYYVSANGSGGNGSKGNPWGPSEIPWTTFESGTINTILYFFGGTYTSTLSVRHQSQTNRLYIKPCSASLDPTGCDGKVTFQRTAGNNIVFTNSPALTNNVTIDGETSAGTGTINIDIFPGELPSSAAAAVEISGSPGGNSGIVLKYVYFTGTTNVGSPCTYGGAAGGYVIKFYGAKDSEISYCKFYNNYCHTEILATADDTTPAWGRLKIHHNDMRRGSLNTISTRSNVDIYNNYFNLTENCQAYDVVHYFANSTDKGLHNIQFYNNHVDSEDQQQFFENNSTTVPSCGGGPCPTEDIRIWNNVFTCSIPATREYPPGNFGFVGGRPIIFKNTISGTNGTIESVYIAHNTFANTQYAIVLTGPVSPGSVVLTNFVAVNNIYYEGRSDAGYNTSAFFGNGGQSGMITYWNNLGDVIIDYNLIYDNDGFMCYYRPVGGSWTKYQTLSTFNAVTGDNNDGANMEGNPNFAETTNYTLGSSSTSAIDKGLNLSGLAWYWSALGYDKNGNLRPQGSGWDIGAYEYTTASPAPPSNLRVAQ